jgi:DNA-binding NtrC family response regulator
MKQLNILYVEDEPSTHSEVVFILSSFKNNIIHRAYNGKKGLELFKKLKDDGIDIDIVITDANLPELNGINMLKEIKSINNSVDTVIITAKSPTYIEHMTEDIEITAIQYKPFDIEKLIEIINEIAKTKE